jgi:hypothetical protein
VEFKYHTNPTPATPKNTPAIADKPQKIKALYPEVQDLHS